MIKIRRGPTPTSVNKPNGQIAKNDYNKKDVKDELLKMQHGKCCYCERNIRDLPETEREIDHFVPQICFKNEDGFVNWHEANKWENLLYSCRKCNNSKRSKKPYNDNGEFVIIDPSNANIDPEEHISFFFDFPIINYCEKNGSLLGANTICSLKLKEREDLILKKFNKIYLEVGAKLSELLIALIDRDNQRKASKEQELRRCMSANLEFSSFTRSCIRFQFKKFCNYSAKK